MTPADPTPLPTAVCDVPALDPDPAYCAFVAAATEAGHPPVTPADLRPDLRRAHDLLLAVRAAGRLSSTTLLPVGPPAAPPRRVGRFELVRELGRGGAGAVFEARDPALGRTVALKLLHPALAVQKAWRDRFRAEGPALARLRHPNVVQVYEAGEADGVTFLCMELLPGPDLHTRLSAGPLPARAAAELVAALADGLAHAHAAGLLHRDLKPANVLLDPAGPKLADFGLAASLADGGTGLTATGEVVGTPNYLAPEALDGRCDARTDVYGLGAVLYECLTGRPPFAGSNPAVTLLQVRTADPASPRTLNPEVPRDLDTVCLKCLNKSPAGRYPTAAAVAADLRAFLHGRPVTARPPGPLGRVGKWVRRHPAAAAGLAAGLLVALAGLGGWVQHTRGLAVALNRVTQEQAATAAALDLADRRGQQLQQSNDVLAGVFLDLDIRQTKAGGEPLSARLARRLLAAGRSLDGAADLGAAARLQTRLASTLRSLGHSSDAVALLERARPAIVAELGEADERSLLATFELGNAYKEVGRTGEARPLFADAARLAEAHLGPDHELTLGAWNSVAQGQLDAAEYDRAAAGFERVGGRFAAVFGPDHKNTLVSRFNLGVCHAGARRYARAIAVYEDVLARRRATLGPDHPDTLNVGLSLANTLLNSGRVGPALAAFEDGLARARAALGDGHPHAISAATGRVLALVRSGRADEAVAGATEAVRLATDRLGQTHPSAVTATLSLGKALVAAGDPGRAVPLHEGIVQARTAGLGPDHPSTIYAVRLLADALHAAGRPADALPLRERAARAAERNPTRHPRVVETVGEAVVAYEEAGRPAEAAEWASKLPDLVKAGGDPAAADHAKYLADHGRCLLRLTRYSEAEGKLLAAHAAAVALPDPGDLPAKATAALADLYAAWGRRPTPPGGSPAARADSSGV